MIGERIVAYVAGGSLVVALGLAGALALGKHGAEKARDVAVAERNTTDDWGDKACGYVRSSYRVYDVHSGKLRPRKEWGVECASRVLQVQQRVDGEASRLAEALLKHDAEQSAKYATHLAAVRRNSARQISNHQKLEAAYEAVTDGHYGYDWFSALGHSLGLRNDEAAPPATSAPGPAGRGPEGPSTAGPADLPGEASPVQPGQ